MKKINYSVNYFGRGLTECKNACMGRTGEKVDGVKVGSSFCEYTCKYRWSNDVEKRVVECRHNTGVGAVKVLVVLALFAGLLGVMAMVLTNG
jgi:hypothetical protein